MKLQVVVVLCSIFSAGLCKTWLGLFACNPDTGDYSIINPDTDKIRRARIIGDNNCSLSFTDDYKILNVTDCPLSVLNLMLDHGSSLSSALMGGHGSDTYIAACNMTTYGALAEITGEASVVDLSTDAGFDQEFVDSDPQVEMALKSVEAAEGYTMFTVGYPMTVELIGPAGTKIKPKECVAYSGLEVNGTRVNKTMIENGCSLDTSLVYSFKENYTSWYEEGLPEDMGPGVVLFSEMMETEGEEIEVQPSLAANIFAFRFSNSRQMVFHCDVQICPSESEDCDFSCD